MSADADVLKPKVMTPMTSKAAIRGSTLIPVPSIAMTFCAIDPASAIPDSNLHTIE
jgi:hypothetical protein